MKRRFIPLFLTALFLLATPAVMAGQENYGCGLGTMIFGNTHTLLSQVAAASTNQAFGSQYFGISSGTSECKSPESLVYSPRVKVFVAENMDSLALDIARGQGLYLEALAALIEVPAENRGEFYTLLQANFSSIYPDGQVTSDDVVSNIAAVMM
ncbi:MAG: DUF3015 family protein [Desulfatibacillaceae bacterium]|nr:DUF3015 family protein [Desulfatibacillaceae bacterium]